MSALPLSIDDLDLDLDFEVQVPADDDIGELVDGFDLDLLLLLNCEEGEDIAHFDASDLATPEGHATISMHAGLCDDDLLDVWFRLQSAAKSTDADAPVDFVAALATFEGAECAEAIEAAEVMGPFEASQVALATVALPVPAEAAVEAPEPVLEFVATAEVAEEPITVEAIVLSAYAIAKAALESKPARRRRAKIDDERQMALF